jgi:mannobiose 2-epimerase
MSHKIPFVAATEFKLQITEELIGNILPFWTAHVVDEVNGGFYGAITNDLQIHNEVLRSAILCARILWTFSAAYRQLGHEAHLTMARRAYDYLTRIFWDADYDGLYWGVDYAGRPVLVHKHHYAQAFGIYGLTEYYLATQEEDGLKFGQELFGLLEKYAYDPDNQGYIEGSSRQWQPLDDMRLSDKDLNCRKSMNTMLHILEAYTNLLRVWDDAFLRRQHRSIINVFLRHIVDEGSGHLRLFFDDQWHSLSDLISFGHDIEASWLLWEAAQVQGDAALMTQVRDLVVKMATAVYEQGLDDDGSLFSEANPQGLVNESKAWWPQAEAMVGFYNAYQLSGQERFSQAAQQAWHYIQNQIVDHTYGDWYKQLFRDGTPDHTHYKVGPWDCPYHQSRACLEMMNRLPADE